MKTQGYQLVKNGKAEDAFQLNDIELDPINDLQVLVQVEAFGLNYADVMARNGLYREAPPLPCVLGYEVVGTIIEIGAKVSPELMGKRIVAFCRFGGYAKHIITEEYAVSEIDNLDAGKALCLATQYVTAYYMCKYITPAHKGEIALVHAAAGGVGTALIQLLKNEEVKIIAKTGSDSKIEYLKNLGAEHIINYRNSDYAEQVNSILGEERLDISFNPVAGSTFKKDFALLGSGGRLLLFGGSERSGKKWGFFSTLNFVRKMGLQIPIGFMMRSKSVVGINMLKIADNKPKVLGFCLQEVVKMLKEGKIDPQVGGRFKGNDLAKAHDLLESGKSTGKIIVELN